VIYGRVTEMNVSKSGRPSSFMPFALLAQRCRKKR
jgi:hypothetical protein